MKTKFWIAAAALGLLAGCGGGGGGNDEPPLADDSEVPASAAASPAAWVQYAASLRTSETDKPKDASKVTPPTTETGAPVAL